MAYNWLLGGHQPVEDDKLRTELIDQINKASKKHGNDMEFGTAIRKLINNFPKDQTAINQPTSEND